MEKQGEEVKKYIFWGIIAAFIILSYLLLKDLLIALITSVILAYITRPLYLKLSTKMNKHVASFTTITIIILIFFGIIGLFIGSFINQLVSFLSRENITKLVSLLSELINSNIIQDNLTQIINEIGKTLISQIPSTISYAPITILNIFVIFFTTFYLLIEWDNLEKRVVDIIPYKNKHDIVHKVKKKTRNIVAGTLFIALVELIVAAIGLKILGVGPYLVLAFAIAILAFIPGLGPVIVWIPLAFIEILYGKTLVGVGVIILGIILSAGIDFALRAKVLGSRTGTHPIVMLVGIIGGIKLFGFIGLILGPLILSILITIIENIPSEK